MIAQFKSENRPNDGLDDGSRLLRIARIVRACGTGVSVVAGHMHGVGQFRPQARDDVVHHYACVGTSARTGIVRVVLRSYSAKPG